MGIILNELVMNALKHAFLLRNNGLIEVSLCGGSGNSVELSVRDNGIGLPETLSIENSPGFGLQFVRLLAEQHGATIEVRREGGTEVSVLFPSGTGNR